MAFSADLIEHLGLGTTTLCRCWAVVRNDGVSYGFTDHDMDLQFEGVTFKADTGLTAQALEQSTGLSVDNTEALGALSDAAIRESDIESGRFDGASVRAWLVNWRDVAQRVLQFRGTMGEITRSAGGFRTELRGLTESLNQPQGRVYQKPCSAVLGNAQCGVDLAQPGYQLSAVIGTVTSQKIFTLSNPGGFADKWFERGRLSVTSGAAKDLVGIIKSDRIENGVRRIELWQSLRADVQIGDEILLQAGCDKRWETCKNKFNNIVNFQGFPDIPGEDWLMAVPVKSGTNTGGSRR